MPADASSQLPRLQPGAGSRPPVRVVHLGLGAFYRAHGAMYLDDVNKATGSNWGICGVSLRSPSQRDKLAPQDFAYTALALTPEGPKTRQIDIVRNVLVASENPQAVIDVMASADVDLVTLTVTEKGYCYVPSTGRLDVNNPDIVHDLANLKTPRSAPGFLLAALRKRKEQGLAPFTAMSCDNLPSNGKTLRAVMLDFSALIDADLHEWIAKTVKFPSTMVDSIVPATTDADIEQVGAMTGFYDASPVVHEPFRQWVIEDSFSGDHPDFAAAGAQMVEDVEPYELMKLRCLNGSHSSLAYLGYLAGHETISDTVSDPVFAKFVKRLWREEIAPSFEAPKGADIGAYCDALFARYSNPSIRHRTWQIAMDGSQKLPQRLLGTIADNLDAGRSITLLSVAVAAWMQYVSGQDLTGKAIDVRDPLASELNRAVARAHSPDTHVASLLEFEKIFPSKLATDARFVAALKRAMGMIKTQGTRGALEALTGHA